MVVVVGPGCGPAAVRVCDVEVSDDEEVLAVPAIGHQSDPVQGKSGSVNVVVPRRVSNRGGG